MKGSTHQIRPVALFITFMALLTPTLSAQSAAYRDEALERLDVLEQKYLDLADAMPAPVFLWRPSEDGRSVSEAYLHVAATNFGITRVFGTLPPEGFNFRGYEKSTTEKTKVVAELKASFEHFRAAIKGLKAEQADRPVKMFGRDTTTRAAAWYALEHLSEHLGQSIAYARSNKIAPPWSQHHD